MDLGLQEPRKHRSSADEHLEIMYLALTSTLKVPISNLNHKGINYNLNSTESFFQPQAPHVEELNLNVLKRGRFHICQVGELSFFLDGASNEPPSLIVLCEGNRFSPAVEIRGFNLNNAAIVSREDFVALQSLESYDEITILSPFTVRLKTANDGAKLLDFLPTDSGFKLLMADNGCVCLEEIDFFGNLIPPSKKVLQLEDSFSFVSFCGPSSILILTSDNRVLLVDLNEPCNYAASSAQFSDQCLLVKYGLECLIVDLTDNTLQLFFPAAKTLLKLKLADLGLDTSSFKFNLFNCAATKLANNEIVVTFVLKDNQHSYTVCILELSSELTSESPPQKFAGYCLALKTPFDWPLTSATVDRHGYLWLSIGDFWTGILVRSAEKFLQVARAF